MSTQSASGVLRVYPLRTGDNLMLSLSPSKPLFQGLLDNGDVSPSWATPSDGSDNPEQPVIRPVPYSSLGRTLKIDNNDYSWKYNTTPLKWQASVNDWALEDYSDNGKQQPPRFALYTGEDDTVAGVYKGQLKIIADLASEQNPSNDTLEFEANYVSDGVNKRMSAAIDVVVQRMGVSTYSGGIEADGNGDHVLTEARPQIKLTPWLRSAAGAVAPSAYTIKWYSGSDTTTVIGTNHTLTVDRDMVNGQQLFVAEFIMGGKVVYRAGAVLTDIADEYRVEYPVIEIGLDETIQTISPYVINKSGNKVDLSAAYIRNVSWTFSYCGQTDFTVFKTTPSTDPVPVVQLLPADLVTSPSGFQILTEVTFEVLTNI